MHEYTGTVQTQHYMKITS